MQISRAALAGDAVLCAGFFWWVYQLNQNAVRTDLEPQRQELEARLHMLNSTTKP